MSYLLKDLLSKINI